MNPEETVIEKIHKYLSDDMQTEERMQFEKELEKDAILRGEMKLQEEIIYAVRRHALAEQLRLLEAEMYPAREENAAEASAGTDAKEGKVVALRTRTLRVLSLVAGVAAVLVLGFWLAPLLQSYLFPEPPTVAVLPPSEFVSPIKGLQLAGQVWELEAEKGKTFRLPGGTTVNIPPDAFSDAQGRKVTGRVQVAYREFTDGLELLASGIPSDDAGKKQETAGMFEIRAYQNNKPLQLDKNIDVRLASFTDEPGYAHFYLASHRTDENSIQPVLDWQRIAAVSELVVNKRKKAYFDSLRAVYYAQAEAQAKAAFEAQQHKAQQQTLRGWQIQALKTDVIMAWLNTQGMEYVGFYPETEDPERLEWVRAAQWQKARAAVAVFVPLTKVSVPASNPNGLKIVFSPDGKSLIIKSVNNTLLYRANGRIVGRLPVKDAVFTADGEHVIGFSDKKELVCYRVADGEFVAQYGELIPINSRELNPKAGSNERMTNSYIGRVIDYDVSLDGKRVVTIHDDESAALWEISGKLISRRKGLPKSWFTEIMFTNRNGTEMIGKMHDETIVYLDAQWQIIGRTKTFTRPSDYYGEQQGEKWLIQSTIQALRYPDVEVNFIDNLTRVNYISVNQNVFYIAQKRQDTWQAVDTIHFAGDRVVAHAVSPNGQYAAMLTGNSELLIWQQTNDAEKRIYRLALESAAFEYRDKNLTKTLQASLARFYTYVQLGSRESDKEPSRLFTFEELLQRNLRVADQQLRLARERHKHEADYLRVFHVTRLGIYRVARPFEESPKTYENLTLFADSLAGTVKLFQLAGSRHNVVIPLGEFSLNSPHAITFDASGGYLIGVLPDDTVLIFAAKDFEEWLYLHRSEEQKAAPPQIVMKKIDESAVNFADMRKLLGES